MCYCRDGVGANRLNHSNIYFIRAYSLHLSLRWEHKLAIKLGFVFCLYQHSNSCTLSWNDPISAKYLFIWFSWVLVDNSLLSFFPTIPLWSIHLENSLPSLKRATSVWKYLFFYWHIVEFSLFLTMLYLVQSCWFRVAQYLFFGFS